MRNNLKISGEDSDNTSESKLKKGNIYESAKDVHPQSSCH